MSDFVATMKSKAFNVVIVAQSLLAYFNTHEINPDNSLVGLVVKKLSGLRTDLLQRLYTASVACNLPLYGIPIPFSLPSSIF